MDGNHPKNKDPRPKRAKNYLNEADRHYEQSELTEASLYDRAMHRPATVEESALQSMEYAQLHRAISELPEIQKRRLILYYFQGLTYEQIAEMEGCTKRAVKFSVDIAVEKLKKFFRKRMYPELLSF